MKTIKIVFSVFCCVFFFPGCEENDDDNAISGLEIEWISGGTSTTYAYSGGVVSGYYFQRSFTVIKESGTVTIKIQILAVDSTAISGTFTVENGKQYIVKVKGSKSGSQVSSPGSSCLTVVFSSPNCVTTQKIGVGSYLVSSGGIDTYYCPKSLIFSDISLLENR